LLLAFLFHTVLHLSCQQYQAIRQALAVRRTFFNDLRALTRYLYFSSWDQLLSFMYQQLELAPG
jgi:anthranilate phosphoribosyltransferase